MGSRNHRRVLTRLWLALAAASCLASLAAGLGCRKQEAPLAPSGAIYYTGPKTPKGFTPAGLVPARP